MSLPADTPPIGLRKLEVTLAVCRWDAAGTVQPWMQRGPLWSITKTPDELSIVCAIDAVPPGVRHEGPFAVFAVAGPLDFSLTGIVSRLTAPLADAGISVFVTATFDTDYVLVPLSRQDDARQAWVAAGLTV